MDSYTRQSPSDEARGRKRNHRQNIDSLKIAHKFLDAINSEVFYLRCDNLKAVLTQLGDEIASEQARQELGMETCREIILSQVGQLEQKLNQVVGAG